MKKGLARALLVVASSLCGLLVAEGLMQLFVHRLPKTVFAHQGVVWSTLAQTSTQELVPHEPYIAILGDSYGAGQGDWLIENGYSIASRHQATHLLHEALGQDVLSLSRRGAGNFDGAVIHSANVLAFLRGRGFDIPEPATVIAYFYAGNDVADNLRLVERYFDPRHERAELFDDAAWDEFKVEMLTHHARGSTDKFIDRFLAGNLLSRYVEGRIYAANHSDDAPAALGEEFRLRLAGEVVPAVLNYELEERLNSEEELEVAVRVFERSLHELSARWPQSRKLAVFLPEPWTTYDFVDAGASARLAQSAGLAQRVARAAASNDFEFLDAAVPLRALARDRYVHGPRDWFHFNRAGYEALAQAIVARLAPASTAPADGD